MIIPLAIVLFAAGAICLLLRRTDEPRSRRRTRLLLYVLGVAAPVLVVSELVRSRPAGSIVAIVTVVSLALVVLVGWVVTDMPRSPAERWAEAHGVEVIDANRDFIVRYVSEGHRLRLICGFGGAIALAALSRGFGITLPVSGWVWLMAGYLGGVVWSEAWLTRFPGGSRREASLTPRRVSDYLVGRLRIAQIVVPVVALGIGAVALIVNGHKSADPEFRQFAATSVGTLQWLAAGIGIAAVVLGVGVTWLQRHIVTKPQPSAEPELTVADDAVRASAVHLLSGTMIGIVLVCIATQLEVLVELSIIASGIGGPAGLICWITAFIAWRYYGHRAWVVHRRDRSLHSAGHLEAVGS